MGVPVRPGIRVGLFSLSRVVMTELLEVKLYWLLDSVKSPGLFTGRVVGQKESVSLAGQIGPATAGAHEGPSYSRY